MRALALVIAALLPVAAAAETVMLQIEAKRGDSAEVAADGWRAQFPDVVTYPLNDNWTAIGLGPMERADAEARMSELKAARKIPADSYLVPQPAATAPAGPGAGAGVSTPDQPEPQPPAGAFISLQALETREAADEALARWREEFPEAGLWSLPNGWFAVALGPMDETTAQAWLDAFRAAGLAPRDAFVPGAGKMGQPVDPGRVPDLPPAGSAEMPPLEEVQRALRWAGWYDGAIDGKDGPKTRSAIAAAIVAERAAPDAPTAMAALIERRAAWREAMGLTRLDDPQSGLSVIAPMDRLEFQRNDQGLSIYGPRNNSGAALILYSGPGGQQEMLDFTGLVTALGWVPSPERAVRQGHASLIGRNDTHIGQAEARVVEGRVEGVVLIWPVMDAEDQPRIAAEVIDSLARTEKESAGAGEADAAEAVADVEGPGALVDP